MYLDQLNELKRKARRLRGEIVQGELTGASCQLLDALHREEFRLLCDVAVMQWAQLGWELAQSRLGKTEELMP